MNNLQVSIYEHSADIPVIECKDFFHSVSLFRIYERTPKMKPYMVVVVNGKGSILCHMMGVIRYRATFIPPFIYAHCLVMGEGEYSVTNDAKEVLFSKMLYSLTRKLQNKVFSMEFSHISSKMFGYGIFRRYGYFPIHWLKIHNSLHSKSPEERLGTKMLKRISRAFKRGIEISEVDNEVDLRSFTQLLKRHNRLKPKRYIPDIKFFREMIKTNNGKLFLVKYKNKLIGCSSCVFSSNNAYLWYTASLRKSYIRLHPETITIWYSIKYAYEHNYNHIYFMDIGLPFRKNPYREFILQFGGKPVSTYRWFRFSFKWLNAFMSWFYRD